MDLKRCMLLAGALSLMAYGLYGAITNVASEVCG